MEYNLKICDGVLQSFAGVHITRVEIPEGVTVIGENAFKGITSIEEVVLPITLTHIMAYAFKGCRKLKTILLPEKLEHIGVYAFHRCHSLRSIIIPNSMKELSSFVFLCCDHLERVEMQSVSRISTQTFAYNDNLSYIKVSKDFDSSCLVDSFTGCTKLSAICVGETEYSLNNIVEVLDSASDYPDIVKAIAADAFRVLQQNNGVLEKFSVNLRHVTIPNGIIAIGKSCFYNKKGIISIEFPSTLKKIDNRAFRNCISLERIVLSHENIKICEDAFKNCTTLHTITFSEGETYHLQGLPYVTNDLPAIVEQIHSQILGDFFIVGDTLFKYYGSEAKVLVPEGVSIIGAKAFAKNEVVGQVILPESVVEIHEEAFVDCLTLLSINIPESVHFIGKSAFENCVKLLKVKLPEHLRVIEKSVFNRCKSLKEIRFGRLLKQIESCAFYACTSLNNVIFPEELFAIDDMAFYKCQSLEKVNLPSSLYYIGNNVFTLSGVEYAQIECDTTSDATSATDIFSQCEKLKKIVFCEDVRFIADKFAFNCSSLESVEIPSTIENVGRNAFEGSIYLANLRGGTHLHVFLDGSTMSGDVNIPEGITVIAGGAFYGNKHITSITMPDSLKSIGVRAFCACTSIKTIKLPRQITDLDEGTFAYCESLESVEGGNLSEIYDNVFYNCKKLSSLSTITSALLSVGDCAFAGCVSLNTLNIEDCEYFGANSFAETPFLENLQPAIINDLIIDALCKRV